ncbi:MAG: GntR family transcriptional regulator [Planctomycetota bacterium]
MTQAPAQPVPASPTSPRDRTAAQVRDWIQSGKLRTGDAVPSENSLAKRFGFARGTVRAALQQLEAEGLIQAGQGRARRVTQTASPPKHPSRTAKPRLVARSVAILSSVTDPLQFNRYGWDTHAQALAAHAIHHHGYHALTVNPEAVHAGELEHLIDDPPAGVILMPVIAADPRVQPLAERLIEAGVPVVAASDDPAYHRADRVLPDHHAGAQMLTRWLLDRGRTRIAAIFPDQPHSWLHQREAGYRQAMTDAGHTPLPLGRIPDLVEADDPDTFRHNVRVVVGYLVDTFGAGPDQLPDALLATTDRHIPFLAAALKALGRTPNTDTDLVGYDAVWPDVAEARFEPTTLTTSPTAPLATIDKHNDQLGRALADAVLFRLKHPDAAPQRHTIAPTLVPITQV